MQFIDSNENGSGYGLGIDPILLIRFRISKQKSLLFGIVESDRFSRHIRSVAFVIQDHGRKPAWLDPFEGDLSVSQHAVQNLCVNCRDAVSFLYEAACSKTNSILI